MSSTGSKPGEKKLDPLILSTDQLLHPTVRASKEITAPTSTPQSISHLTQENCGSDFLVLSIKHLIKCPDTQEHTKAVEKLTIDSYEQRFENIRKNIFKDCVDIDASKPTPAYSPPNHQNIEQVLKLDAKQIVGAQREAIDQNEPLEEHNEVKTPIDVLPEETQWDQVKINAPPTTKPIPLDETVEAVEAVETDTEAEKASTSYVAPRALPFSEEDYVRVKIISHEIDFGNPDVSSVPTENITWMQRDAIKHYLTIQGIERRRVESQGAVYRSFRHDA